MTHRLTPLPLAIQVLLFLIVAPAAIFDWRDRCIPNWLTFSGLAAAFACNGFLFGLAGLVLALKGLGIALLVYIPLYALRGMGGGDVKLMAAVGAAAGWANWIGIFVLTAIFGGAAAIIAVASRGRFGKTFRNVGAILMSLLHFEAPHRKSAALDVRREEGLRLPHAIPIAFGTIAFLLAAALGFGR